MSADNGVYIAKFKDGYRVTEASAIDNLSYYPAGSLKEKEIWYDYFGHSPLYATEEEATLAAHKIAKEYTVLEYGVRYLGNGVEWGGDSAADIPQTNDEI